MCRGPSSSSSSKLGAASQEPKHSPRTSPRPPNLQRGMAVTARAMARKLDIAPARRSPRQGGCLDGLLSPTSPLDRSALRGWRHREAGGVGLGILAALEAQPSAAAARVSASIANAVASPRRAARLEVSELGCSGRCATSLCGAGEAFRVAEFLVCCDLCRRPLDGKDIFMYRGERAFCSMECRYQAIVSDEFQEKERKRRVGAAPLDVPKKEAASAEMASSPCAGGGQIFFTGIVVA